VDFDICRLFHKLLSLLLGYLFELIDSNDDNFYGVIFWPTKLFLRDMLEETWRWWEAVVIVDGRITWLWTLVLADCFEIASDVVALVVLV
jgi:hypothetical protein